VVSEPEGDVDLRILMVGAGATIQLTPMRMDFRADLGLGMGAAAVWYEGQASAPYEGRAGNTWAAAPFAEASASYLVHPIAAIRLDLIAALLRPEPVVRMAQRDVASFGQPAFHLSLGVEVRP
jgi:hypothetical protein